MIKFFRKIRQRLLTENKFSKYLLYAIGEILLVVIGILIALQIDNLNEKRKAIIKTENYLVEILKDLASDTIVIDNGIRVSSILIQNGEWALGRVDYTPNQVDSLWTSLGGFNLRYSLNDKTFQKIQYAGESKLIGFDSVFNRISFYYTVIKERFDNYVNWDKRTVTEQQAYMQDMEEYIEISNFRMNILGRGFLEQEFLMMQDSSEQTKFVIDFAKSTRGRNHFKNDYIRHLRLWNFFKEAKQEAINLIAEIKQELNQLEK